MREQTFALEPRRRRDGSRDYEQREAQFKINPWEPGATGANQDALRGIGVQTPGERDAEERFKKKKKSLDPHPLSFHGFGGGLGACRFCYSLGMKLKGREKVRAISILFVSGFLSRIGVDF